jgi:hypothetical protein
MTSVWISQQNRKRMIAMIALRAPWLTQGDIGKWVGCSNRYVSHVLLTMRLSQEQRTALNSAT